MGVIGSVLGLFCDGAEIVSRDKGGGGSSGKDEFGTVMNNGYMGDNEVLDVGGRSSSSV
jgi:hypothetical protein